MIYQINKNKDNTLDLTKRHTVCVIIPNYNDLKYLGKCIDSILNQVVSFDQIIFVDDASTDTSLEFVYKILGGLENASIIANKKNKGTISCINQALEKCNCDYVLFLSANDFISPYLIKRFHYTIEKEAGFWSALCQSVSDDGIQFFPRKSPIIASQPKYFSSVDTVEIVKNFTNWSPGTTVLYNREKILEHGGLSKQLKGLSDWLLAIIVGLNSGVVFVPEILGTVRVHPNSYLNSTLKNEEDIQLKTDVYLRDKFSSIPDLKVNDIDQIMKKIQERVKLNIIISNIRNSHKIGNKLKNSLRLSFLLFHMVCSRSFLRFIFSRNMKYMQIFYKS